MISKGRLLADQGATEGLVHVVDFFVSRKHLNAHAADQDWTPVHDWGRVRVVVDLDDAAARDLTFTEAPMIELMPLRSARMNANVLNFIASVVLDTIRVRFIPEKCGSFAFDVSS